MITNKDIKKYEHLVYSIVNRCRNNTFKYKTYIDWDEVEQVGIIALWHAIEKYNPDKGTFKNYAITAIKRAIRRHLDKEKIMESHSDIDECYDLMIDTKEPDTNIDLNQFRLKVKKIILSMENSMQSKDILISNLYGESISSISKRLNVSHQYISKLLSENNKRIINKLRSITNDNRE